jgi:hypothetical protein
MAQVNPAAWRDAFLIWENAEKCRPVASNIITNNFFMI